MNKIKEIFHKIVGKLLGKEVMIVELADEKAINDEIDRRCYL